MAHEEDLSMRRDDRRAQEAKRTSPPEANGPRPAPSMSAARLALASKRARTDAAESLYLLSAEPIAIIGIGCRFPGRADSPAKYWELLKAGRSGIREIPEGRWPSESKALPKHLRMGGYLDQVDLFDPEFFGIAPKEAHSIDPQQRLLLEVCWEALADAGVAVSTLNGTDAGVFVAVYSTDYFRMQMAPGARFDAYTGVGAAHSVAAGRLSFLLNLRGPCLAIDTACSSSLVATQLACRSLRQHECGVAIVGSSSLKLLPDEVRIFEEWGMLSSDGRAKTFDASADGFVPGEGCAVVILKRLSDAIAQGDPVRAIIRGAAVNHDGRSSVLTAPNGPAQEAVLRSALRDAQVQAREVSYVETHGTGTALGDPIEVEALQAVYGVTDPGGPGTPCLLGAVKTNLGHLEASAGMAGLIKAVLALENEWIPGNLNFSRINPQIQLDPGSRLRLANEPQSWVRSTRPRFAAVSSFGLGGTNAHLILEEAPQLPQLPQEGPEEASFFCLPVSAHTVDSLRALVGEYQVLLRRPGTDFRSIARAAARTRDHGEFRLAVVASTAAEAADLLQRRLAETKFEQDVRKIVAPRIAFIFSGQGCLWNGFYKTLASMTEAGKVLSECESIVEARAGWSLRLAAETPAMLDDTAKSQPLLFAAQMAILKTLGAWGIVPTGLAGHSVGEIAAATAAGVLTLEQGMWLALRRGAMMAAAQGEAGEAGRMLAAEINVEDADKVLQSVRGEGRQPEIAAVNGPQAVVFSGPQRAMQTLADSLRGVTTHWLDVKVAFHSEAMRRAAESLAVELSREPLATSHPQVSISLVSTVTGKMWEAADGDSTYWSRGVRQAVMFQKAVETLGESGFRVFVEIGPRPTLLRNIEESLREKQATGVSLGKTAAVASMRRGLNARAALLETAARMYESGLTLRWSQMYPGIVPRTELPTHAWLRKRFWLEPVAHTMAFPPSSDAEDRLPGKEVVSPFLEGRMWILTLSTGRQPWLAEHTWQRRPILPFAAWIEIARHAALAAARTPNVAIRDFAVHQPVFIDAETPVMQVHVSLSREIRIAVQLGETWTTCASGYWEPQEELSASGCTSEFSSELTPVDPAGLYAALAKHALHYGPPFRRLRSLTCGTDTAAATIAADANCNNTDSVRADVTALDACLQAVQAAMGLPGSGEPVLPFSVASYHLNGRGTELASQVKIVSRSREDATADIRLLDSSGGMIGEIVGLRVRRAVKEIEPAPAWMVRWQPQVEDPAAGQDAGRTQPLTLKEPGVAEPWSTLLAKMRGPMNLTESVEADSQPPSHRMLAGSFDKVVSQLFAIVAQEDRSPGVTQQICLVTRGGWPVLEGERCDPDQAALVGLIRSFRAEYPGINVIIVDLPPGNASVPGKKEPRAEGPAFLLTDEEIGCLTRQLLRSAKACQELALRHGRWYEPRLEKATFKQPANTIELLEIGTPGLLESLQRVPCTIHPPAEDEVQIECRAHGLNFRDVLTSLGTYAGAAGPLGAECSGVVVEAGARSGLAKGEAVLAFAPASLRSRVNVPAAYVAAKPSFMTFAEAAAFPVAFLTAHYAFSRLACLTAGQSVLIHSAAGGLGQAAIQLARLRGALIFSTAGSASKRTYLKSLGIDHIFDSRNDDFADGILKATSGRGVDVVLNALSGDERIAGGFRALAQGGVFVEVGKRDIWTLDHVAKVRPDAQYFPFDLGEVAAGSPALIAKMMSELLPEFTRGELNSLPQECFALSDAEGAFRKMAGGTHIGKLILLQPAPSRAPEAFVDALRDGTALITGGCGALGIATARWLVDLGAKSLVLMGRRGNSDLSAEFEHECGVRDVRLILEAGDVSDRQDVSRVLARARSIEGYPLRILIHAAGQLVDQLLCRQTEQAIAASMRSKLDGARLLDELTEQDDLRMTVYYSSVAGMLGSAAQAGYAAANAGLDALAALRTSQGRPTLSIRWGAWRDGGMHARLTQMSKDRLTRQGATPMTSNEALAAMMQAVRSGSTTMAIADMDWVTYTEQFPGTSCAGLFLEGLLENATRPEAASPIPTVPRIEQDLQEELRSILADVRTERAPRMATWLRGKVRKVLGLSAGRSIPGDAPLQEMGLDSLMALELRNLLAHAFVRPLSATLLFDHPSIDELSCYLLTLLEAKGEDGISRDRADRFVGHQAPPEFARDVDMASLSDDEAEALLLAELTEKVPR